MPDETSPAPITVVPLYYQFALNQLQLDRGWLDIYDVLNILGIVDHELAHAFKKIAVAGRRGGGKKKDQDVTEAIVALRRYLERNSEEVWARSTNFASVQAASGQ